MKRLTPVCLLSCLLAVAGFSAVPRTLTVALNAPARPISPDLFGIFFEDLNYAAEGGLYAELIQNRSFEYSPTEQAKWGPVSFWDLVKTGGSDGHIGLGGVRPVHANNPHYLLLTVLQPGEGVGLSNQGFDQIPLVAGAAYEASFWGYQTYMGPKWSTEAEQSQPMPVTLRRESKDGTVLAEARVAVSGREWQIHRVTLTPARAGPEARLVVLAPRTERIPLSPEFDYEAPANSLTILRISGR